MGISETIASMNDMIFPFSPSKDTEKEKVNLSDIKELFSGRRQYQRKTQCSTCIHWQVNKDLHNGLIEIFKNIDDEEHQRLSCLLSDKLILGSCRYSEKGATSSNFKCLHHDFCDKDKETIQYNSEWKFKQELSKYDDIYLRFIIFSIWNYISLSGISITKINRYFGTNFKPSYGAEYNCSLIIDLPIHKIFSVLVLFKIKLTRILKLIKVIEKIDSLSSLSDKLLNKRIINNYLTDCDLEYWDIPEEYRKLII